MGLSRFAIDVRYKSISGVVEITERINNPPTLDLLEKINQNQKEKFKEAESILKDIITK